MITYLPLLDAAACGEVVARIDAMRASWINRAVQRDGTFYTLGRASYLDVCLAGADPEAQYYQAIVAANAELSERFGDLYLRIQGALSGLLEGQVTIADGLAMPGFHVFCGSGILGAGNAGQHFDIQYSKLRLPGPLDGAEPVSFTLALELPVNGSGLDVWDLTVQDFDRAFAQGRATSVDEYAARRVRSYWPYQVGYLSVHGGLWLHRLHSLGPILPSDRRITLQGHALRIGGRWQLYW